MANFNTVSYTHLDVYKRQHLIQWIEIRLIKRFIPFKKRKKFIYWVSEAQHLWPAFLDFILT